MTYQQRRRLARKSEPTTVVAIETAGLPKRLVRVPTSALPRLERAQQETKYRRALAAGMR